VRCGAKHGARRSDHIEDTAVEFDLSEDNGSVRVYEDNEYC
jgi:hypothetical protein